MPIALYSPSQQIQPGSNDLLPIPGVKRCVIARNSSSTYKGHAVDVKQVGRELAARYVLEGSVQKPGD
jgi:hypothetical protein